MQKRVLMQSLLGYAVGRSVGCSRRGDAQGKGKEYGR